MLIRSTISSTIGKPPLVLQPIPQTDLNFSTPSRMSHENKQRRIYKTVLDLHQCHLKIFKGFVGQYFHKDSYILQFETVYATDTRVFYRDVGDIFDIYSTDLNDEYVKFEHKVLDKDTLPLCVGQPFRGKLFERLIKES